MEPSDVEPQSLLTQAREFSQAQLGPASRQHLDRPEVQALILSRVRNGTELPDAVLGIVHEGGRDHSPLADEFVGYVVEHLIGIARPSISPQLRQLLDTQDLVQSVMADLWPDLSKVEFTSRAAFVSLLAQRIRWKTVDRARRGRRARRREDLRVPVDPQELELPADGPSPLSDVGEKEAREAFEHILTQLSERDQEMLRLHAEGAGVEDLMDHFGLEREAARKALQRAVKRARTHGERWQDDGD